jgi:hypothetical protein
VHPTGSVLLLHYELPETSAEIWHAESVRDFSKTVAVPDCRRWQWERFSVISPSHSEEVQLKPLYIFGDFYEYTAS